MVLVICYNFLLLNKSRVEIAANTIAFVSKAYTTYNDDNILEEATAKSFLSAKMACWGWITNDTAFYSAFFPTAVNGWSPRYWKGAGIRTKMDALPTNLCLWVCVLKRCAAQKSEPQRFFFW